MDESKYFGFSTETENQHWSKKEEREAERRKQQHCHALDCK